jgi:hypothetical protein
MAKAPFFDNRQAAHFVFLQVQGGAAQPRVFVYRLHRRGHDGGQCHIGVFRVRPPLRIEHGGVLGGQHIPLGDQPDQVAIATDDGYMPDMMLRHQFAGVRQCVIGPQGVGLAGHEFGYAKHDSSLFFASGALIASTLVPVPCLCLDSHQQNLVYEVSPGFMVRSAHPTATPIQGRVRTAHQQRID